jgi:hypothetical protein
MFLLQEDCLDCPVKGMNMAENELIAKLTEKGYPLIDKSQLEAANQMGQARLALSGNVDAAKQLGAMFGAKYVLVGKAVIQDGGEIMPGAGLKSIQTNIQDHQRPDRADRRRHGEVRQRRPHQRAERRAEGPGPGRARHRGQLR